MLIKYAYFFIDVNILRGLYPKYFWDFVSVIEPIEIFFVHPSQF